jgi:hypothetical protein
MYGEERIGYALRGMMRAAARWRQRAAPAVNLLRRQDSQSFQSARLNIPEPG